MWNHRIEKILELLKKSFLYLICLLFLVFTSIVGIVLIEPILRLRRKTGSADSFRHFIRRAFERMGNDRLSELRSPESSGPQLERFRNPDHALTSWRDKQTEWWYFSGNLYARDGRHFAYELVFFRRKTHFDYVGVFPGRWIKRNLSVAHFALANSSAATRRHQFRYWHRGGFFSRTQAFFSSDSFHAEVGGWSAFQNSDGDIQLNAQFLWDSISLKLHPSKGLTYNAKDGYSQRDDDPAIASYHCAYTRMRTTGTIIANGEALEVEGLSWLDHEKMQAGRERLSFGWDWYSMQLENEEELMLYLFRNRDGSLDRKYSHGTHVDKNGKTTHLTCESIQIHSHRHWRSPDSGGAYPIQSSVSIPSLDLKLEVSAVFENCELNCMSTSYVSYWEGPIKLRGIIHGKPVGGHGFLELCGYDRRMSTKLVHFMLTPEPRLLAKSALARRYCTLSEPQ
jgi:predicted secreted hydrolase